MQDSHIIYFWTKVCLVCRQKLLDVSHLIDRRTQQLRSGHPTSRSPALRCLKCYQKYNQKEVTVFMGRINSMVNDHLEDLNHQREILHDDDCPLFRFL